MRIPRLIEQLRNRHIVRTAVLYLGVAWGLAEATGFLVDNYDLSRKLLDVAVLLLMLGFPAALIIAWYHGEKGNQQVVKTEASLLLTLAVLGAIGTYRISTADPPPSSSAGTPTLVSREAGVDLGEGSVAVLPFSNATGADSLAWLGPGLSDMITTNLARVDGLRVVSPQRLFELLREAGRGETERIPRELAMQIAGSSGARTMITGSILGSPDSLALDAQLVDLGDGTIIAAERVRGSDVFAMADTVAGRLSSRLLGSEVRLARRPRSPLALSGDLDPYRKFFVGLRESWENLDSDSVQARLRAAEALALMPGREEEMRELLEEAAAIDPDNPRVLESLARVAIREGREGAADSLIRKLERVERTAPRPPGGGPAELLEEAGRWEEARRAYRRQLESAGGEEARETLGRLARTWLRQGEPEGVLREMEPFRESDAAPALQGEAWLLTGDAHAWSGRFERARQAYLEAERIGAATGNADLRAAGLESELYLDAVVDTTRGASRINRSVWTLLELGRAQTALNVVEAEEQLHVEGATRLFPVDHHVLLYARGRAMELLGESEAAARAYEELLRWWGDVIDELPRLRDAPERLARLRS